MTKITITIDGAHKEETRVAVIGSDGKLLDFDRSALAIKQIKGNIYLSKVVRVEPSLQACFVDYGSDRHGFLPFADIHPDYYQISEAERQKLRELNINTPKNNDDDENYLFAETVEEEEILRLEERAENAMQNHLKQIKHNDRHNRTRPENVPQYYGC